jgi:hypothetical protein
MRDDLAALNIGQAGKEYDNQFFYRSYRDIEMFMSRLLSKGPVVVSDVAADTATINKLTVTGTVSLPSGGPLTTVIDLLVTGNASFGGTVVVTGATTLGAMSASSIAVSGTSALHNTTVTGTLGVTGNTTIGGTLGVTGTTTMTSVSVSTSLTPSVTGTVNLGSSTLRWATVFTSDLSLNNGIGDWTIVEGEDDLFLYNNKRNRTYKFALVEVDPSTAPPKKV